MRYLEDGNVQGAECIRYDQEKKNILLIGDSIRIGYCETVKQELADVANVFWPDENCRNSQYIVTKLRSWAAKVPSDMDLIQFNCGHWDVAHWNGDEDSLTSPEEYAHMIRMIIRQLIRFYPKADLVFATTSAMNPSGVVGVNPRTNREIVRYNEIAVAVAKEMGVQINDVYGVTVQYGEEMFADYCHLTVDGFGPLGKVVASFMRDQM